MKTRAKHEKGMTLIELVVVMVLVSLLAGFLSNVIFYEVDTYEMISSRKEKLQDSRFAFRLLSRDIRQIVAKDSIFAAETDSIAFKDIHDSRVSYEFKNKKIYRNGDILAAGILGFKFTYFNGSGNIMPLPINDPTEIRAIGLNMKRKMGAETVNYNIKVTPRNF